MTRRTPFDVAFAQLAEEQFDELASEAAQRNQDLADRGQFAALPSVQRMLAEIEAPDLVARDPEAAAEYLSLLYAAYHYWAAGRRLVRLDRTTLEERVAIPTGRAPAILQACYVQLPERAVWAQTKPHAPHEPLDGMFIVPGPHGREFTIVAVLGLRPEREGFSQVSAVATPEEFAAARVEARTPPFTPVLDGGERMGFKSVTSPAELLLLASVAAAEAER